jgi:hypothetical protein
LDGCMHACTLACLPQYSRDCSKSYYFVGMHAVRLHTVYCVCMLVLFVMKKEIYDCMVVFLLDGTATRWDEIVLCA